MSEKQIWNKRLAAHPARKQINKFESADRINSSERERASDRENASILFVWQICYLKIEFQKSGEFPFRNRISG